MSTCSTNDLTSSNVSSASISMNTSLHHHHHHHHSRSLSLSRQSSVASLTGLVETMNINMDILPEPDEGMSISESFRSGSFLHLIVLSLLLFVTLNDVLSKSTNPTMKPSNHHKNMKSSSMSDSTQDGHVLSSTSTYPPYGERNSDGTPDNKNHSHRSKKKGLLGPAMIQSVTEALSPILPFAGGIDLRRDESWKSWNSWLSLWDFDKKISRTFSSTMTNTHDDDDDNVQGSSSFSSSYMIMDSVTFIPRGGEQIRGSSSTSTTSKSQRKGLIFHTKETLGTTDPFFPLEDIEQMTLQEMVSLFHYAVSPTIEVSTFMRQSKFPDHVNTELLQRAIVALEDAVRQSRGKGVSSALTTHDNDLKDIGSSHTGGPLSTTNGFGDIDALNFCAVMRILAEWRVLRQVPPGYKGYSVGMNLGHKDIVQNIVKIESAIHNWIEERSEAEALQRSEDNVKPRSPTLRELLEYEIEMDVHPNNRLPRLKDKTAAMGLLWVRRQLQYQTAIFRNIIGVPDVYPTTINAVTAAYAEVYGNLHGWTVQKIFNYSFQSAPDADLIYRHMNPSKLKQIRTSAKNGIVSPMKDVDKDEEIVNENVFVSEEEIIVKQESPREEEQQQMTGDTNNVNDIEENVQDNNHFVDFFTNIGNEWDKFSKHITDEIDKICNNIGKIFGQGETDENLSSASNTRFDQRGGANFNNNANMMSDDETEAYISKEMAADAREHILVYLDIIGPILNDLTGLFDEMNMDDPTKV